MTYECRRVCSEPDKCFSQTIPQNELFDGRTEKISISCRSNFDKFNFCKHEPKEEHTLYIQFVKFKGLIYGKLTLPMFSKANLSLASQ